MVESGLNGIDALSRDRAVTERKDSALAHGPTSRRRSSLARGDSALPAFHPVIGETLTGVVDHPIEDELKDSYLTYAMSVIVSRALPDVRDGLKPSQRRILVAMNDLNLTPGRGPRQVREDLRRHQR